MSSIPKVTRDLHLVNGKEEGEWGGEGRVGRGAELLRQHSMTHTISWRLAKDKITGTCNNNPVLSPTFPLNNGYAGIIVNQY